jgi:uncharacterized protein
MSLDPTVHPNANLPHFSATTEITFAQPFWDAIAQHELRIPRCSVCGEWQWYPDDMGTCCAEGSLAWTVVSGTGTVHTMTVVRRAFLPNGGADVPFTIVFVDLDDAPGVRLVGNTTDPDVEIGSRVFAVFEHLGDRTHPVFKKEATDPI